jgi:hypothetical protein
MKKILITFVCLLTAVFLWSQTARVQIIHNSASPTVDIWVNGAPFLTGFKYRTATPYVDVPAGTTLNIGVAPSPSDDPGDIIANFPVNFTPGETYAVIATGLVGNARTPFTLKVVKGARERAVMPGMVDLVVSHGSTDAPAVDVLARGVAKLVSGAAYGDVTDYLTVPAGDYTLDITPAGQNSEIVATYSAPLSGLAGGAVVVFASGFLSPAAGEPGFGLYAALANGKTFALDVVSTTKDAKEIIGIELFPNPVSEYLIVNVDLNAATELELHLFDNNGKLVFQKPDIDAISGIFNVNIPMESFSAGNYYLRIKTASGIKTMKVLKQ